MYILFKKNVIGSKITDGELLNAVEKYNENRDKASNLSVYLYDHVDFQDYKPEAMGACSNTCPSTIKLQETLSRVYTSNIPNTNSFIHVSSKFDPQRFFFSNNDLHLCIVGDSELMICSTKSGKTDFTMNMPCWSQVEEITTFGQPIGETFENSPKHQSPGSCYSHSFSNSTEQNPHNQCNSGRKITGQSLMVLEENDTVENQSNSQSDSQNQS